jgi:hypothetical protein
MFSDKKFLKLGMTTTRMVILIPSVLLNQSINQSKHLFKHDKTYSIADVVVH